MLLTLIIEQKRWLQNAEALEYKNNQYTIIDTAYITDNQFVFDGTLENGPFDGSIKMEKVMGRTDIFVESSDYTIDITDNLMNAIVKGGETQNLITWLQLMENKLKSDYNIPTVLNLIENGSEE